MPRKMTIGVVGPGEGAGDADIALGHQLGKLIAEHRWILLSGGRAAGVMDAVNRGAKAAGGLTVGVIPSSRDAISEAVEVALITDMGSARNNIIVLSSDVVVSCGRGGAGTASEIALALKAGKHVVLLGTGEEGRSYFQTLGRELVHVASTPVEAVEIVGGLFAKRRS